MSIPLHLVTGFLGSGKTTFLKNYLEQAKGKGKIAIIQNEFSPVNIDGREIQRMDDYHVLEINNGSVFCVCLLGSFVKSLAAFIDDVKPDELIMEASGLSDPVSIGQILQAEPLKGKVYLGHVWSVVDAHHFLIEKSLRNRIIHQLKIADTILINKMDLAGEKVDLVIQGVKQINPFAKLVTCTFAKVQVNEMKKAFKLYPDNKAIEESGNRPDLESIVVKTTKSISLERLHVFIEKIKPQSIRCKGYINIKNGEGVFLQGVYDEYQIESMKSPIGLTELIVIGHFSKDTNFQLLFENYCKQ